MASGQVERIELDGDIKEFLSLAETKRNEVEIVSWADVVGLQDAKDNIRQYIVLSGISPGCSKFRSPGILLYGAPGTGKTMLVRAVVAELCTTDTLCFNFSAYTLLSRLYNDPVSIMQAIFKKAWSCRHAVIIVEDMDALSQSETSKLKDGRGERTRTEFLNQMKCLYDTQSEIVTTVVGVTNKPWRLADDAELLKVFGRRVHVGLPEVAERTAILKQQFVRSNTNHSLTDEDFVMLGEKCGDFTGADLSTLVRDASMQPVRAIQIATHFRKVSDQASNDQAHVRYTPCLPEDADAIPTDWTHIPASQLQPQPVTMADVLQCLSTTTPSVSKEEIDAFDKFMKDWMVECR